MSPWIPFLWVVLASAAAHLWCMGSQFYMDDVPQILENPAIPAGEFLNAKFLAWTQFWQNVQYRLFGMSAPGIHAVNWLLHTTTACALFGFGRDFLRGKSTEGVALFGAILFAVHPLGSEIPNYARTQDLAWVTLFSILAAWSTLLFLRKGSWELIPGEELGQIPIFQRTNRRWTLLLGTFAVAGSTFSKGPGLFHAMMAVGVVALAFLPAASGAMIRKQWIPICGVILALIGLMWFSGVLDSGVGSMEQWKNPRFVGHGYTVARVFWEFVWRSFLPVSLSSDHQIAETLLPEGSGFFSIPDKIAMLSAVGMLLMMGLGLILARREQSRHFGVCLSLFVGTILFRVLYLIPEFMPEYRIYPGLPWFCLGAAIVSAAVWGKLFAGASPRLPAVFLICTLAVMSAKRSFAWHDLDRLAADILRQYPAQGRAVWELHDRDARDGNWQGIIDRQQKMWPEVVKAFVKENARLAPARELPTGHFVLAEIACEGKRALALAHLRGPAAGLRQIAFLELRMKQLRLDPVAHITHWDYFSHDKALVLEVAGKYREALDCFRLEGMRPSWKRDYDRIASKLAASQP